MMRRTSFLGLSFCLLFACSGINHSGQRSSATANPVEGDWAVVQLQGEPDVLNPITSVNAYAREIEYGDNYSFIYQTMLQYNPDDHWHLNRPLLAEAYPEVSADHLRYTFKLRDGVKWHDGSPFTVDDVIFSAKVTMCPAVDDAATRSAYTDLINVEGLPDRKVQFTFSKPYFLNDVQLGSLYIVPKHIFDPDGVLDEVRFKDLLAAQAANDPKIKKFADDFNKSSNNRVPVGTGPYKFEKWETSKEIRLVRNDDYWGPLKPHLDKLIFRIIQDQTAGLTALKSGELDLVPRLTGIQYAQQTSGRQFDQLLTKTKYSLPQYYYLGWNEENPLFKDKRVRQALTMLVPRQQIVDSLRFGLGQVALGPVMPDSADFNSNLKPLPYDPKRAMELLDEAGWKTNAEGIREKDGVQFRFEMLGAAQNDFADHLLPVLKEEFRKAGLDMVERRLEFTVQINSLKDHKFDAFLGAWASSLQSDLYQIWHSSSARNRGSNFISYKNPRADSLLEAARMEFDPEQRRQLYWKLQEILHDEQPYTFLLYSEDAAAYAKRFQNVRMLPARPGYDLTQWFVSKPEQKYPAAPLNN